MAFAQLNLIHSYGIVPSVLINNCVLCWHLSIKFNDNVTLTTHKQPVKYL